MRRSSWAAATSSRRRASRPTAPSSRGSPGICRTSRGTAPSCGSRNSTRPGRCPANASSPGRRRRSRSSSRSGVRTASCTSSRTGPAGGTCIARSRASVHAICPMDAEFGWPQWVFGVSTYAFLDDGRIACIWTRNGEQHVSVIDPRTGELLDLDLPYDAIDYPFIAAEGQTIAFVGGSYRHTSAGRGARLPCPVGATCCRRATSIAIETVVPVRPSGDRVPDGRRPHRARVLLPAGEPGLRGVRRRAAAADRDEPRRSDVARLRGVRHRRRSSGPAAGSRSST